MNDKTENASASEPETPISSPASTTASRPYSEPKDSTTAPQKRKSGAGPAYALTAVVVVLAAAGLWYQNSLLEKHKAELQSQLATNINTTEQARQTAQQALALAQRQSDKLTQLEKSFNDSTEQFHDLSQAFQTMTDSGSELVLLNDIDHLATIAQQQLMLGGNVANAIVSLEAAQAQLARANRVGLASLQQTLNGDLERLRAAATVDVASLSRQLDTLSRYVSEAPLLVPDDVAGGANTEALDLSSVAAAAPAVLPQRRLDRLRQRSRQDRLHRPAAARRGRAGRPGRPGGRPTPGRGSRSVRRTACTWMSALVRRNGSRDSRPGRSTVMLTRDPLGPRSSRVANTSTGACCSGRTCAGTPSSWWTTASLRASPCGRASRQRADTRRGGLSSPYPSPSASVSCQAGAGLTRPAIA